MKLIKLTKQGYNDRTIMINPQYITVIEEMVDGTYINVMMGEKHLVKESVDKVMKMIDKTGWSTIYNVSMAQDNAE